MESAHPYKDLVGSRFGRLTVLRFVPKLRSAPGPYYWQCRCDCGNRTTVNGYCLRSGMTKSCGCWRIDVGIKNGRATRKHGDAAAHAPEYRIWANMKDRCFNPKSKSFKNYGSRGIKVCKRWMSYTNFLTDMNRRPSSQHSLDRYPDNNGDYKPTNCRWATQKEQNDNRRNFDHGAHLRGKHISRKQRSKISAGINRNWIIRRQKYGKNGRA